MEKVFSYRKNSTILDSFISSAGLGDCLFLYEKLSDQVGWIFYTKLHIFGCNNGICDTIYFTDGEEYVKEKQNAKNNNNNVNDHVSEDDSDDDMPALEKRLDMPLTYDGQEEEENDLHGDCKPLDPNTDLEQLRADLDRELDDYARDRDIIRLKIGDRRLVEIDIEGDIDSDLERNSAKRLIADFMMHLGRSHM